jgi:hypothetical protein
MQTKPTNRMRVFTDEEIVGINGPNTLTEQEVSNVSGGSNFLGPIDWRGLLNNLWRQWY